MKRKPPSLDKPYLRHRLLTQDEEKLWREETGERVSGETADEGVRETGERVSRETGDKKHPHTQTPEHLSPRSPRLPPPRSPDSHLDKPTLSKIRREAVSIQARLDLHGHTKATAHAALLRFIAAAQARGVRLALIITGKGGKNGGTLRGELPRWLNESPLREAIIAYDVAGPRHGGEGAWYVRIRRLQVTGYSRKA